MSTTPATSSLNLAITSFLNSIPTFSYSHFICCTLLSSKTLQFFSSLLSTKLYSSNFLLLWIQYTFALVHLWSCDCCPCLRRWRRALRRRQDGFDVGKLNFPSSSFSRLRSIVFSSLFCEVNNESWWEIPTFLYVLKSVRSFERGLNGF